MKNRDKILKYLAGNMPENELKKFEDELKISHELQNELELVTNNLNDLKVTGDVKFDDRYFSAGLVRAREKAESERKIPFYRNAYIYASAVAVVLLFAIFFNTGRNNGINFDELENEIYSAASVTDSSEIEYILKKDIETNYVYYTDLVASMDLSLSDEAVSEIMDEHISNPYNFNYRLLEEAGSDQIDELYNEILDAKIL